jgi:hypothetical protein
VSYKLTMRLTTHDLGFVTGLNRYSFPQIHESIPRLSDRRLSLLINWLGCLIERRYLSNFSSHEIHHLCRILSPYKSYLKSAATYKNNPLKRAKAFREIRTQTGRGIILSSLIAAAVPLITTLITNLTKKK